MSKYFNRLPFFSILNVAGVLKKKIPNLYQHLSSFTTFTVPFIREIISPIDISTSPVVNDQTDRGLNCYLLHLAAMLKEKIPNTRREIREKPSLS